MVEGLSALAIRNVGNPGRHGAFADQAAEEGFLTIMFEGGAILPAGQQKGYGLALVAEIMAEAVLGPSTTEGNWLLLVLDTRRYREQEWMYQAAEAVLEELRNCPPAPGYERVEIPGERERDFRKESQGEIQVPERTWQQIQDLAHRLGV